MAWHGSYANKGLGRARAFCQLAEGPWVWEWVCVFFRVPSTEHGEAKLMLIRSSAASLRTDCKAVKLEITLEPGTPEATVNGIVQHLNHHQPSSAGGALNGFVAVEALRHHQSQRHSTDL